MTKNSFVGEVTFWSFPFHKIASLPCCYCLPPSLYEKQDVFKITTFFHRDFTSRSLNYVCGGVHFSVFPYKSLEDFQMVFVDAKVLADVIEM